MLLREPKIISIPQSNTTRNDKQNKNHKNGDCSPQLIKVFIFDDYLFERVSTKTYEKNNIMNKKQVNINNLELKDDEDGSVEYE